MDNKSDPKFAPGDLNVGTDFTYRQLNDWDAKGLTPPSDRRTNGWRKFNFKEAFTFMVCTEIHIRFGTPMKKLQWLKKELLDPSCNYLPTMLKQACELGVAFYLLTDLETTCQMDTDLEYADLIRHQVFAGSERRTYIFLNLNWILKHLLSRMKSPVNIEDNSMVYDAMLDFQSKSLPCSEEEIDVLRLIRGGEFRQLEIVLASGAIKTIVGERDFDRKMTEREVRDLFRSRRFQTISLQRLDGKTHRIVQRVTFKPGKKDEARERRKNPATAKAHTN